MNNATGFIVAIITAITFGIYPPATKLAYTDGANPVFIILVTTFFRAAALTLFCKIKRQRIVPKSGEWRSAIIGGFCQALSTLGLLGSFAYLPGAVTVMVMFSHSIMLLLFLAYKKEIELTSVAVVTTIAALIGLSFVVDVWSQKVEYQPIGLALAFMAAITTTSRLYVWGKQTQDTPPAVVGAQTFIIALVCMLVFPIYQWPVMPNHFSGFAWTALSTITLVLGTFGMFFGIKLLGPFRWSLMVKFEPVFTAIFSILLLNEVLLMSQYFGMFLVLVSIVSNQVLENRKKTVPAVAISTEP